MWEYIPAQFAPFTPKRMAWFSIIPFFSILWNFIAVATLPVCFNKTVGKKVAKHPNAAIAICAWWALSYTVAFAIVVYDARAGATLYTEFPAIAASENSVIIGMFLDIINMIVTLIFLVGLIDMFSQMRETQNH
jgi:hypothetical protein